MKRLVDFLTPDDVRGKPLSASLLFNNLVVDSRKVQENDLFLVVPSLSKENRDPYILEALEKGAKIILLQQDMTLSSELQNILREQKASVFEIQNSRLMMSLLANKLFPEQPATIVGITGTNGKTSVTSFVRQLWELLGERSASIGTLGVQGKNLEANEGYTFSYSTPDPLTLYPLLKDLSRQGITHLSMEVSSHGLDMYRAEHVQFKCAVFTNLSHEHLDYHKTMDAYFQAKVRFFKELLPDQGTAVINIASDFGQEIVHICKKRGVRLITVGQHEKSDLYAKKIVTDVQGSTVTLNAFGKEYTIFLPLIGQFQVENVLTALAIVTSMGSSCDAAIQVLEKLEGVKGRMEVIGRTQTGASVIVDYAHKPLALETVLKSLRAHTQRQIIVVFGCGGNRDHAKREMMGKIAREYADCVVITDDNPRLEDPEVIRKQIMKGAPQGIEIASREEAIAFALHKAEAGDICLIAGKGHEEGQTIGSVTHPFCDRRVAQNILKKMEGCS